MKFLDCDLCPRNLECKLTGKKDKIIKKWWGNPTVKYAWDEIDKSKTPFRIGWVIGIVQKHMGNDTFDNFWEDIKVCIKQVTNFKQNQLFKEHKKKKKK